MHDNILFSEPVSEGKPQEMTARINGKHPLFAEHFENNPILPGAISLNFCITAICQKINHAESKKYVLAEIEKVNFTRPIKPYAVMQLEISQIIKESGYLRVIFEVHDNREEQLSAQLIKGSIKFEEII